MTIKNITFGLLLTTLLGCHGATNTKSQGKKTKSEKHFPNVIQVQQFGDTVRLEIEKRGDTIIKHFIDLKGIADDNFDNSYNAVCTYREKLNDTTLNSAFYLTGNGYRFYIDNKKVVSYCDSIINGLTTDFENNVTKPHYEGLKKIVQRQKISKPNDIIIASSYHEELLLNFNCKIVEIQTGEKPKSLLIEFYRTEFSGGKTFYIIRNQGDTIELFHYMDYIN